MPLKRKRAFTLNVQNIFLGVPLPETVEWNAVIMLDRPHHHRHLGSWDIKVIA